MGISVAKNVCVSKKATNSGKCLNIFLLPCHLLTDVPGSNHYYSASPLTIVNSLAIHIIAFFLISGAAVCHTLPLTFMSRGCWFSICCYTWFSDADTGFLRLVRLFSLFVRGRSKLSQGQPNRRLSFQTVTYKWKEKLEIKGTRSIFPWNLLPKSQPALKSLGFRPCLGKEEKFRDETRIEPESILGSWVERNVWWQTSVGAKHLLLL